ncbi:MAG: hypothetical protein ACRDL8_21565, partial [Solirubrobacteraceae bacterium]
LEPASGLAVLLAVVLLVATPVQPWYAVAAAGVAMIAGFPWLLAVALAAEPYYAAVVLGDPHQIGIGRLCYAAAAVLVVAAVAARLGIVPPRRTLMLQ